jgi:tetratricopeptide (TPR) repeat protein
MTAPRDRWAEALRLVQAGQLLEAESAMRTLSAEAGLPDQGKEILARLSFNRAVSIWKADLDTAEALLREAMKLAPNFPKVRHGLAEVLLSRVADDLSARDWPASAAAAMEAATLWPEIGAAQPAQARNLAEELRLKAIAIASTEPVLATRLSLAGWRLSPQSNAYATCRSLFVHLGVGGVGSATDAAHFEEALQADPGDLVALLGLANLRRQAGRLHAAEQLCRSALQHHPDNPFARGRLASLLVSGTRYREADRLYQALGQSHGGVESVIRLTPDFLDALRTEQGDETDEAIPEAPRDLVIFAGCDAKYFHRFADGLANSIAKHCPSTLVHFHVVNPDDRTASRIAAAQERHPGLQFRLTVEQAPDTLKEDAIRTFFACARFLMLPDLLRSYNCPVLMLDVDAVLLRSPHALVDHLRAERADVALVHGDQGDPWSQYWADAILACPTDRSLEYFALVRNYIRHFLQQGRAIWFLDQVALFAARIAGFDQRPAPRIVEWPADIQNSDTLLAYFWSLHMSQPSNAGVPDSALYLSFKNGGI